jgi:hypothetical protein
VSRRPDEIEAILRGLLVRALDSSILRRQPRGLDARSTGAPAAAQRINHWNIWLISFKPEMTVFFSSSIISALAPWVSRHLEGSLDALLCVLGVQRAPIAVSFSA